MKLLLPIPCRSCEGFSHFEYLAYLWTIEREPTSGLEPLICSLRVIGQALQRFALVCKSRIFRQLSLLWLATRCTVLRSRWYQSGINIDLVSTFDYGLPSLCCWGRCLRRGAPLAPPWCRPRPSRRYLCSPRAPRPFPSWSIGRAQ